MGIPVTLNEKEMKLIKREEKDNNGSKKQERGTMKLLIATSTLEHAAQILKNISHIKTTTCTVVHIYGNSYIRV